MAFTAALGALGGGGGGQGSSAESSAKGEATSTSTGSTAGGGYRGSVINNFSVGGSSLDAKSTASEETGPAAGLPVAWIMAGLAVLVLGGIYLWKKL